MTAFDRMFAVALKPWVIVICLACIAGSFLYLDEPIAHYYIVLDPRTNLPILNFLTQLGLGVVYIIPLFLLALFFRYIYPNKIWEVRAWFLWLCVIFTSIVCLFLKIFFGRARPDLLFSDHLYGFFWFQKDSGYWSFPSGHTSTVMGFVFGLCALFPRYCYFYILAGLALVSTRVMLTHHFLSDILMATYLAFLEVGLLFWWFQKKKFFVVKN